jgi:hypothetical protein
MLTQNVTLDELNAFKSALALEREERVAEDDEIVQVCRHVQMWMCLGEQVFQSLCLM